MDFEVLKDYLRPYYLKWFYFHIRPESRADYLAECWNNPHFPVSTKLRDLIAHDPSRPDLLFLPMSDWHARIQRTQHLAMGFGELGHRCFFVNPHLGREFPRPYSWRNNVRAGLVAPQTLELHIHLPREPIYHHRLLTEPETDRILSAVARLAKATDIRQMIQFVSFPLWTEAAVRIRREFGFPIVYDCHDLLSGFEAVSKSILDAEATLFQEADLVSFSSQLLQDENMREHPALARKSVVVRNAVNPHDYAGINEAARSVTPTVGYVGSLDFWFDTEAIRLAASRRPDWNFVLIGRIESPRILELKTLPNVSLQGEVPYSELPSRMSAFDVAVIPFLKIPLTRATNPLKLYEYFCLGLPVVSTRLPEIEPFGDLVYLSDSAQEFSQQLDLAMAESAPAMRGRRRAIALENSWGRRCEQLNQCFHDIVPY